MAVLVTAALAMAPATAGQAFTAPAAGSPSADASIVTLTALTPPVASPGAPVVITGTVTARVRPLTQPAVRVVAARPAIMSRDDVTSWVAETGAVTGKEVGRTTVPATLQPGQSAAFSVTVPDGALSLSRAWGAIPLALEVTDADTANHEVVRTFVGWQRAKQYEPLSVAVVAPVTLSPRAALFDADPTTRTAAWTEELSPGGRIDRVLSGTDSPDVPVTWAVDPAVLGRPAATGTSPTTAGPDPVSALLGPLRARLAAASTRHTLWALPYADADLAATVQASPQNATVKTLVDRSSELGAALGVPVQTGVAWPADGGLPPEREKGLASAYGAGQLRAALVSSSALPTASGFTGTADRRSPSGLPLLAWDDELSRLSLETASPDRAVLTSQRFVAETAALLGQSPGITRTFVVAMPRTIDPDVASMQLFLRTLAATPWLHVVGTDEVRAQSARSDPVAATTAGAWTLAGPAQMDAAALERIGVERQTIDRIASLFPEGAQYRAQWNDALNQLTSTRWRQDPAGQQRLSAMVSSAGGAATSGIHVNEQTTNFLADEGVLQVTVVNDLDSPVEGLRLVLVPTNPRLRIVAQPDPVRIEKQSRATIQVRAQAVAAGLVPVTATLTTADGTPIGVGTTITIRANPPGRVFYVVSGIVVGLVLLVGIIRTLRGRRRRPS